jgi:hypothetical protein
MASGARALYMTFIVYDAYCIWRLLYMTVVRRCYHRYSDADYTLPVSTATFARFSDMFHSAMTFSSDIFPFLWHVYPTPASACFFDVFQLTVTFHSDIYLFLWCDSFNGDIQLRHLPVSFMCSILCRHSSAKCARFLDDCITSSRFPGVFFIKLKLT